MAARVGINGFGRIGRNVFKALHSEYGGAIEVVAANDLGDADTMAHLLKYDSTYGPFCGGASAITRSPGGLCLDGQELLLLAERDPARLPWGDLGVDIVIEATGAFTDAAKAKAHLAAGARKVIITAPAQGEDLTVCMGVNQDRYDPARHRIISSASGTTNCLATVAAVVLARCGIVKGFVTTVHSSTAGQRLLDNKHRDLRRGRSTQLNIVPTTTGATGTIALVIPELRGKVDGFALRVPTPTVSIVDFVAQVERTTTAEGLNAAFKEEGEGNLRRFLGYTEEPLVSSDFRGDSRTAIVDGLSTMVIGGDLVKVVAWYDNEWGYSRRVADLAALIAERGFDS